MPGLLREVGSTDTAAEGGSQREGATLPASLNAPHAGSCHIHLWGLKLSKTRSFAALENTGKAS